MAEDIFDKVFSFISGDNEPDAEKRNFLRQILRDINENKYTKFYKPRTEEMEPAFANVLYEIYTVIRPASIFIRDLNKATRIRQLTLEVFMDKPTLAAVQRLNPALIEDRIRTTTPRELIPQLNHELKAVSAAFDDTRLRAINITNNQIIAFTQFVTYPFFAALQRFDTNLPENPVDYQTRFASVKAKDMLKYLEDLLVTLTPLNPSDNWKTVLGIMRLSNGGTNVIPQEQWNAVMRLTQDIRESNILERIIQYTLRNPLWHEKIKNPSERLAQTWLENKENEIQRIINELTAKEWNTQVRSLAQNIFGSADIVRLQFYTERESENLTRRGLDGYVFAAGLNYLAAFIIDFINREFQDLCDILLIRGQWTTASSSRAMSEAFHGIKDLHNGIAGLDETLGEKGKNGLRIKNALARVEYDRSQARYINAIVSGVNEEAREYLTDAAERFKIVETYMKNAAEDFEKNPHELIINWKELALFSKTPLGQRLSEAYQKISVAVHLLDCFRRHPEEEE
ncbi:MAG: DUF5312 family protein [Treponema sp.]|jgi:hypothetical protein|nr:DUF5312 family protein [Treponema sp.]